MSATNGSDATGDGTSANPFRTITMGLQVAGPNDIVRVGAGTYDAALGEVFPLQPGPGVTVRGTRSFASIGSPKHLTHVIGGGLWDGDPDGRLHGTFVPAAGSTLFGLSIQNPEPFGPGAGPKPAPVILSRNEVTIESCSLHGSDKGIRMVLAAQNGFIKRCEFSENSIGIFVDGAGTGNRVEDCTVTGNVTGVMVFSIGVDFGGGLAGSTGGNAFVNSEVTDFVYITGTNVTAFARNCFWDIATPTVSIGNPPSLPEADIWQVSGTVDTTGAKQFQSSGGPIIPLPPGPVDGGVAP